MPPLDTKNLFAFDPSLYPRDYRLSTAWRWICWGMGVPLLSASAGLAWEILVRAHGGEGAFRLGVYSAAAAGAAIYLICQPIRARLRLTAASITLVRPFLANRSLQREEIAGTRALRRRGGIVGTVLIPNRANLKPLELERVFATDEAYTLWVQDFPCLDASDGWRVGR